MGEDGGRTGEGNLPQSQPSKPPVSDIRRFFTSQNTPSIPLSSKEMTHAGPGSDATPVSVSAPSPPFPPSTSTPPPRPVSASVSVSLSGLPSHPSPIGPPITLLSDITPAKMPEGRAASPALELPPDLDDHDDVDEMDVDAHPATHPALPTISSPPPSAFATPRPRPTPLRSLSDTPGGAEGQTTKHDESGRCLPTTTTTMIPSSHTPTAAVASTKRELAFGGIHPGSDRGADDQIASEGDNAAITTPAPPTPPRRPKQLKRRNNELAQLAPFAWDKRTAEHPVGQAMATQFEPRVGLRQLLEAGLLQPGPGALVVEVHGQQLAGTLLPDGVIAFQDRVFGTPSAFRLAATRSLPAAVPVHHPTTMIPASSTSTMTTTTTTHHHTAAGTTATRAATTPLTSPLPTTTTTSTISASTPPTTTTMALGQGQVQAQVPTSTSALLPLSPPPLPPPHDDGWHSVRYGKSNLTHTVTLSLSLALDLIHTHTTTHTYTLR